MHQQRSFDSYLDLRGTPCPVNFVRCNLALEKLLDGEVLKVDLDKGEPEDMVIAGLEAKGYKINITSRELSWLTLLISCEKG